MAARIDALLDQVDEAAQSVQEAAAESLATSDQSDISALDAAVQSPTNVPGNDSVPTESSGADHDSAATTIESLDAQLAKLTDELALEEATTASTIHEPAAAIAAPTPAQPAEPPAALPVPTPTAPETNLAPPDVSAAPLSTTAPTAPTPIAATTPAPVPPKTAATPPPQSHTAPSVPSPQQFTTAPGKISESQPPAVIARPKITLAARLKPSVMAMLTSTNNAALRVVSPLSKPLAAQSGAARLCISLFAAYSVGIGAYAWYFTLCVRPSTLVDAAAAPFDLASSHLPEPPKQEAGHEPAPHGKAESHGEAAHEPAADAHGAPEKKTSAAKAKKPPKKKTKKADAHGEKAPTGH